MAMLPAQPLSTALSVPGKKRQKAKNLKLRTTCGHLPCSAKVKGRAVVPGSSSATAASYKRFFDLKRKTVELRAGQTKKVELKFKNHKKWTKRIAQMHDHHKVARKHSRVLVQVKATNVGSPSA
jgi:hypothetical protein